MTAGDLFRGALTEIRAHRTRSALTCVALSVGVAAALYTLSETGAVNKRYREAIALGGPGRVEIEGKGGYLSRGLSKGLTADDARALRESFPELFMVSPVVRQGQVKLTAGTFRSKNMMAVGITDEWRLRQWVYRLHGRFLNARDVREAARVCVLIQHGGWHHKPFWAHYFRESAWDDLLKKRDLLGTWLTLEGHSFRVVGVIKEPPRDLDPRWNQSYWGEDGLVLVPITTYGQDMAPASGKNQGQVEGIYVDTGDAATVGREVRRMEALLSYRHRGEDDVEVVDYRQLIAGALGRMRRRIAAIAAIGLVAILAGGIGILNVTLATVFSRVREIGVRRALGATRRDVVAQFVVEALTLGAISGVVGSALGTFAVLRLSPTENIAASFTPLYAVASTVISVAVSFAFSVGPAWQASRLDPIEALRYE